MKTHALLATLLMSSTIILTSCASQPAGSTPSLSQPSRITSRQPSPSNYQRNIMMDSSRMTAPQ